MEVNHALKLKLNEQELIEAGFMNKMKNAVGMNKKPQEQLQSVGYILDLLAKFEVENPAGSYNDITRLFQQLRGAKQQTPSGPIEWRTLSPAMRALKQLQSIAGKDPQMAPVAQSVQKSISILEPSANTDHGPTKSVTYQDSFVFSLSDALQELFGIYKQVKTSLEATKQKLEQQLNA